MNIVYFVSFSNDIVVVRLHSVPFRMQLFHELSPVVSCEGSVGVPVPKVRYLGNFEDIFAVGSKMVVGVRHKAVSMPWGVGNHSFVGVLFRLDL